MPDELRRAIHRKEKRTPRDVIFVCNASVPGYHYVAASKERLETLVSEQSAAASPSPCAREPIPEAGNQAEATQGS